MTELRKAAEMALLTLEGWSNHGEWVWPESALDQAKRNTKEAIEALRQALAQEQNKCPRCGEVNPAEIHTCSPQVAQFEQEPVAWLYNGNLHFFDPTDWALEPESVQPLYTSPVKQTPVAWRKKANGVWHYFDESTPFPFDDCEPLYEKH